MIKKSDNNDVKKKDLFKTNSRFSIRILSLYNYRNRNNSINIAISINN